VNLIDTLKNKDFKEDIKTFFDGLRNIGICVALVSGLPFFEKLLSTNCLKYIFVYSLIGMILALFGLNIFWVHNSLKSPPQSKKLYLVGFIVVFTLVTIAIAGTVFSEVWPKILIHA
jgi:hypothetical protein